MDNFEKSAFHPDSMVDLEKAGEFARGKIARAKRDVFAEGIKRGGTKVREPYAVATSMVRKGAEAKKKKTKKAIKAEFKEQKAAKKKSERKRRK